MDRTHGPGGEGWTGPFRQVILLLCSIRGVSGLSATTILAEIGRDMTRRITGVLSCYDQVVITGTHPGVCYPDWMMRFDDFSAAVRARRLSG